MRCAPCSSRSLLHSRTAAEKRAHLMREIVETLLFVGIVFFIVQFAIRPYRASDTMMPQLQPDQLVLVNRAAYLFGGPGRGDVVVYADPTDTSVQRIGRVIAIPGDTITVSPTQVIVNNVTLNEPYISVPDGVPPNTNIVSALKLGPNDYFVMNDSRLKSPDSRSFGTISRGNIVGKAEIVFWPLHDVQGISTYPNVFSGVSK